MRFKIAWKWLRPSTVLPRAPKCRAHSGTVPGMGGLPAVSSSATPNGFTAFRTPVLYLGNCYCRFPAPVKCYGTLQRGISKSFLISVVPELPTHAKTKQLLKKKKEDLKLVLRAGSTIRNNYHVFLWKFCNVCSL